MKVIEIFKSIDGEGIRAGYPVTFIRLAGCNLRCSYCDTRYSYENEEYTEMSVEEIVQKVCELKVHRVTLTGGEPLIHEDVYDLYRLLIGCNYEVNIETNGSMPIKMYQDKRSIITMDYKCPSSGMEDKMLLDNLKKLRTKDVLKFVVGSLQDLDVCYRLHTFTPAKVFISPVFGKIEPVEIVDYILEHNMNNCRVQLQLHKIIWEPDKRGV